MTPMTPMTAMAPMPGMMVHQGSYCWWPSECHMQVASNTEDAVTAFARQLGIQPSEDAELGWIAENGLQAELPPRWTSCSDPNTGYTYFVDEDTQNSSWDHPLLAPLQRVVQLGRCYLQGPSENFFEGYKDMLWQEHKDQLDSWHGPFSDFAGRTYFVNTGTGVASGRDPRVEAQYLYELESAFLDTMAEVLPPPMPDTPGKHWRGEMWRTADGAEVLNLEGRAEPNSRPSTDGARPSSRRALTPRTPRDLGKVDHRSTFKEMCTAASMIGNILREEEEVQKIRLAKKFEARRRRKVLSAELHKRPSESEQERRAILGDAKLTPLPPGTELPTAKQLAIPLADTRPFGQELPGCLPDEEELEEDNVKTSSKAKRHAPRHLHLEEEPGSKTGGRGIAPPLGSPVFALPSQSASSLAAHNPPARGVPSPANKLAPPMFGKVTPPAHPAPLLPGTGTSSTSLSDGGEAVALPKAWKKIVERGEPVGLDVTLS